MSQIKLMNESIFHLITPLNKVTTSVGLLELQTADDFQKWKVAMPYKMYVLIRRLLSHLFHGDYAHSVTVELNVSVL